jgi:glycosyltransferase involved in cell wall biosynthesis
MRDGDGLVLFSDYENLPCVVAEAMACGLPVIATRVGGVPEQVFPGSGLLIEPRDEEGLQRAMAEMIDHAGRFDRAAIREFAEREYSLAAVGRRFLQLYRDALAGRRGPS